MNIGIGRFYCFQKRNPQLFLKIGFFVDGAGEGMEKAGSLFGGPAFCVFSGILFDYYLHKYATTDSFYCNRTTSINFSKKLKNLLMIPRNKGTKFIKVNGKWIKSEN